MKKTARQYYLHRKVKEFTTVNSHTMQVEVSDKLLESLTEKKTILFR